MLAIAGSIKVHDAILEIGTVIVNSQKLTEEFSDE